MAHNMHDTRKVALVLLVAAALIGVGGIASFSAKYAHRETDDAAVASEAFYFTSDLLTSDGGASYNLPVGTTSISFELRNFADDLRWSEGDVAYDWHVTDGSGNEAKNGSGSLAHSGTAGTANTVEVKDLTPGTYKVTATSTSPYHQELSATFTIAAANSDVTSRVEDSPNSATATLVVSTADYAGNVTVSWPVGVIPDASQEAFKDVTAGADGTAGGNVTVHVDRFSSYSFRFFKTNTGASYSDGGQISARAAQ